MVSNHHRTTATTTQAKDESTDSVGYVDYLVVINRDRGLGATLKAHLNKHGFRTTVVADGHSGLLAVKQERPAVVLMDLDQTDAADLNLAREVKSACPTTGVIVLASEAGVETAVKAIKCGADDFIVKPYEISLLAAKVRQVTQHCRRDKMPMFLPAAEKKQAPSDPRAQLLLSGDLCAMIDLLAEHDSITVRIDGETGTGKSAIARAIHALSDRRDKPFVDINCASLSESLLESELLGHDAGAYTGATQSRLGLLEAADGGTLFLDEIAAMSRQIQAKLLKVVEDQTFRRVGSTQQRQVNVRFITASNRTLQEAVRVGDFREDLYHRIGAFPLTMAPLRERRDEIIPLAHLFLAQFCRAQGIEALPEITSEAECLLIHYQWPGNIRELKNVIERALVYSRGDSLRPCHLSDSLRLRCDSRPLGSGQLKTLDCIKREHINQVLADCGNNKSAAARTLGIHRVTLAYKLRQFDVTAP